MYNHERNVDSAEYEPREDKEYGEALGSVLEVEDDLAENAPML